MDLADWQIGDRAIGRMGPESGNVRPAESRLRSACGRGEIEREDGEWGGETKAAAAAQQRPSSSDGKENETN